MIIKREFAPTTLDLKNSTCVVYRVFLSLEFNVYLFDRARIASLNVDEAFMLILSKYADLTNVYFLNLGTKLPK